MKTNSFQWSFKIQVKYVLLHHTSALQIWHLFEEKEYGVDLTNYKVLNSAWQTSNKLFWLELVLHSAKGDLHQSNCNCLQHGNFYLKLLWHWMRNESAYIRELNTTSLWLVSSHFLEKSVREAICSCPSTSYFLINVKAEFIDFYNYNDIIITWLKPKQSLNYIKFSVNYGAEMMNFLHNLKHVWKMHAIFEC